MSTNSNEYNREYLRAARARAKEMGMCGVCRARPAKLGRVTCQDCLDRNKQKKAEWVERGKCVTCGVVGIDTTKCLTCQRRRYEAMRKAALESGKCARCRWPALRVGGLCASCTEKNRVTQEALRSVTRTYTRPPMVMHCRACGEAGHNARTCR